MNGEIAELPPNTINIPINKSTMINGANHHFLRALRKLQRSFRKSMVEL